MPSFFHDLEYVFASKTWPPMKFDRLILQATHGVDKAEPFTTWRGAPAERLIDSLDLTGTHWAFGLSSLCRRSDLLLVRLRRLFPPDIAAL